MVVHSLQHALQAHRAASAGSVCTPTLLTEVGASMLSLAKAPMMSRLWLSGFSAGGLAAFFSALRPFLLFFSRLAYGLSSSICCNQQRRTIGPVARRHRMAPHRAKASPGALLSHTPWIWCCRAHTFFFW